MVMSCHQNAGQNHNLLTAYKFFQNVAQLKCLKTTGTNQKLHSRRNWEWIRFGWRLLPFNSGSCLVLYSYLLCKNL